MKYTTKTGKQIELNPIPLSNREGFKALQRVIEAATKFEKADKENNLAERFATHDEVKALCDAVNIPYDAITEGDLEALLVGLQTGEIPEQKKPAAPVNAITSAS